MSEDKKDLFDSLAELSQLYQQTAAAYESETFEWWNNLPYEDRLRAFYSVCRRIYKGDVEERRSYRGVLYDTFGFDPSSYGIGMECGYMELHNLIFTGIEAKKKEIDDLKQLSLEFDNGTTTTSSSS